jgi:hypothetical protein
MFETTAHEGIDKDTAMQIHKGKKGIPQASLRIQLAPT